MIPKPPNHWVILRHRSSEAGRLPTSGKMVAPVEVNPDSDSKKASVNDPTLRVKRNGNVPNKASTTHIRVTVK